MSKENPHVLTEKLPNGYDGQNVPVDFTIPSCGLEDIDRSLFELFNKRIGFTYNTKEKGVLPVPVIFAGGERFALLKDRKPVRDKNGVFILPLISITRTDIDQSEDLNGWGRSIGVDTGDFTIKKRLDKSDRRYQNVKNKLALQNQTNVATVEHNTLREETVEGKTVGTLGTRRQIGSRQFDLKNGNVLNQDLSNNIVEIITVPFPEFFTVKYEIIFWAQYQQEMNVLLEQMMASYQAQGNQYRLETDKGYWFTAFIGDSLTPDSNFKDYTDDERLIKYTFTIETTGYMIAPQHAGQRSPFRRYVSAPMISFDVKGMQGNIESRRPNGNGTADANKFILEDTMLLDKSGEELLGRNHSTDSEIAYVENPFSGKKEKKFLRVKLRYQRKGETVLSASDLNDTVYLSIVI